MSLTVNLVFEEISTATASSVFARHRAGRLDIGIDVEACSESRVTVCVIGQEALVDMFEMACSLGPTDCIVRDVRRLS